MDWGSMTDPIALGLGFVVVVVTQTKIIFKWGKRLHPLFCIIISESLLVIPFYLKDYNVFIKYYFMSLPNTKNVNVHFTISNYLLFSDTKLTNNGTTMHICIRLLTSQYLPHWDAKWENINLSKAYTIQLIALPFGWATNDLILHLLH